MKTLKPNNRKSKIIINQKKVIIELREEAKHRDICIINLSDSLERTCKISKDYIALREECNALKEMYSILLASVKINNS